MVRVNHSSKCNALVRAAENMVLIKREMFACSSYHDFRLLVSANSNSNLTDVCSCACISASASATGT